MVNDELTSDLASFDTETSQWALVPSFGTPPTPRKGHVMVASEDGRYLWVFGGSDASGTLADLSALDMDHQTWRGLPQRDSLGWLDFKGCSHFNSPKALKA